MIKDPLGIECMMKHIAHFRSRCIDISGEIDGEDIIVSLIHENQLATGFNLDGPIKMCLSKGWAVDFIAQCFGEALKTYKSFDWEA